MTVSSVQSDARLGQWEMVQRHLRDVIGPASYQSWIAQLRLRQASARTVCLAAPTRFIRDWVDSHYVDHLRRLWREQDENIADIRLILTEGEVQDSASAESIQFSSEFAQDSACASPEFSAVAPTFSSECFRGVATEQEEGHHKNFLGRQEKKRASAPVQGSLIFDTASHAILSQKNAAALNHLSASLDSRFTFDNFVVGKPNELAHAAARRVAESSEVSFNPLFLYGGVGLGKSHLMHAIAWHIRRTHPERRVLYLSAEKFMYQFIRALRDKDMMVFKEIFRSVDVLMIDDVQFISGKDSTQEEFFHTFNALVDQGRQLVISADKSPSDLEHMEERLRSRLGWGLVADLHPTTYELRLGILQSRAERHGINIADKVLEFLAHQIRTNVRELEGALNRIIAHCELVGRPVTIEICQDLLQDLLRARNKQTTIAEIQKQVAEHYNIRQADMSSARRLRQITRPRQIAMYLGKELTGLSYAEIGRKFGGRDHTTVKHAVLTVEELCRRDAEMREDVALLRRSLSVENM